MLEQMERNAAAEFAKKPLRMTTSLFADSEFEGTYSCLGCRQTITRTLVKINMKWGLKPACPCVIAEREQEEKEQERKIRRAKMERIYARSIMNEDLKQATFHNFIKRSGTERVCSAAADFVRKFDGQKTGLVFHGKPGNGKSHLAAAIHHELNRRGWVCLFLDVPQLFNMAKDSNRPGSKVSLTDIINGAIAADLLTLDELGSGYLTEYEFNDILFPILNGRQGKPTNYTMNLDLKRLRKWFEKDKENRPLDEDGRLYDRIIGSTDIYENLANSKRREDAIKRFNGGG